MAWSRLHLNTIGRSWFFQTKKNYLGYDCLYNGEHPSSSLWDLPMCATGSCPKQTSLSAFLQSLWKPTDLNKGLFQPQLIQCAKILIFSVSSVLCSISQLFWITHPIEGFVKCLRQNNPSRTYWRSLCCCKNTDYFISMTSTNWGPVLDVNISPGWMQTAYLGAGLQLSTRHAQLFGKWCCVNAKLLLH